MPNLAESQKKERMSKKTRKTSVSVEDLVLVFKFDEGGSALARSKSGQVFEIRTVPPEAGFIL